MRLRNYKVYIALICIALFISVIVLLNMRGGGELAPDYDLDNFVVPNRSANVNEYSVANVQEKELVGIYFNTFITMMIETPSKSYGYLDADYRNQEFPTFQNYLSHIQSITDNYTKVPKLAGYTISKSKDIITYYAYDTSGNQFIFKTNGIMNYVVYFDRDSVKIE